MLESFAEAAALMCACITEKPLKKITLSSPLYKNNPNGKIVLEPKQSSRGSLFFQFSVYYDNQVKHENDFCAVDAADRMGAYLSEGYKQWDIILHGENIKVLMNQKQQCKIIQNGTPTKSAMPEPPAPHNVEKNYILRENTPIPWLISLGVMEQNGRVVAQYRKKFKQLNKFLEMIDDVADQIPQDSEIIDFGCGKSYLTFALYYYLNIVRQKNVSITGLDLKTQVVAECQRLAESFGFDRLRFLSGDIKDYRHDGKGVDMVVTLHACDTATDYALFAAITWRARIILTVPCCQHELFRQIENETLNPLLRHGILKERFAALLTDACRASLLELCGYRATVMEFIDMEHTPKNIMIRAVQKSKPAPSEQEREALSAMLAAFHVEPALYKLLAEAGVIPGL